MHTQAQNAYKLHTYVILSVKTGEHLELGSYLFVKSCLWFSCAVEIT